MKKALPVILIITIAFAVRLIGLNYGLPFTYHDDEPVIVNYALAYGSGDFNPHVFKMSPFLSYVLFLLYGFVYLIGYLTRFFHGLNDFAYFYLNDPTLFYMIGRSVYGLMCGTISVFLAYIMGQRYGDRKAGILAALFLALNYLHVRDSHYSYFDVPLTLFTLFFFIKAYDFFSTVGRRDYLQLGALLGLAVSVKYSGAFLALPCAAVILYNSIRAQGKTVSAKLIDIVCLGASCLLVIFILNPFAFISIGEFMRDISAMPYITPPPYFHLKTSLINGCGMALVIMAVIGMLRSTVRRDPKQILLVSCVIFYYMVISGGHSQIGERLAMPLVPIILFFAATVVVAIDKMVRKKIDQLGAASITVLITVLLMFPSVTRVYYSDSLFSKEDTRTIAYRWVTDTIEKGSRIALDATASWFPRIEKTKEEVRESMKQGGLSQFDKPRGADRLKMKFTLDNPRYPEKTYYLFYLKEGASGGFASTYPSLTLTLSDIKSRHVDYVILSHMLINDRYKLFVDDIEKHCQLIMAFSPYKKNVHKIKPDEVSLPPAAAFMLNELKDRERYGPVIKIYKVLY